METQLDRSQKKEEGKSHKMELEKSIRYKFKNIELLEQALTHKSYANENNIKSNETLEFLGDSILQFISSKYLYTHFGKKNEGELSKIRATVVCEKSLYQVAQKHEISKYIRVGHSELANSGNKKPAILADSIEAIIAAIFFDGGLDEAEKFILENLTDSMKKASNHVGEKDYKTVLQEKVQVDSKAKITYRIVDEFGPDHNKTFVAEVIINDRIVAKGEGKSKKQAEMEAAKKALEK